MFVCLCCHGGSWQNADWMQAKVRTGRGKGMDSAWTERGLDTGRGTDRTWKRSGQWHGQNADWARAERGWIWAGHRQGIDRTRTECRQRRDWARKNKNIFVRICMADSFHCLKNAEKTKNAKRCGMKNATLGFWRCIFGRNLL